MDILIQIPFSYKACNKTMIILVRPVLLTLLIILSFASCGQDDTQVDEKPTLALPETEVVVPTATFDAGEAILPTAPVHTRTPAPQLTDFQRDLQIADDRLTVIRQLSPLHSVSREFISRNQLTQHLIRILEEERKELERKEELYKFMGIIEADIDLHDLYLSLYKEGVLGFFDGVEEKLYVVKEEETLSLRDKLTYVHELVHALQQQHFDIQGEHDLRKTQSADRVMAYSALVEGDATLSESIYMNQHFNEDERELVQKDTGGDFHVFLSAPHLIQRALTFPYIEGTEFTFKLFQTGTWSAVNLAFTNPPVSTEQILHPEKYLVQENPVELFMPDMVSVLGSEWSLLDKDTMGEFFLLAYFEERLLRQQATDAASGWGGDVYHLLSGPNNQKVLIMRTAWDTNKDAVEFGETFRMFTRIRLGGEWEGMVGRPGSAILVRDAFVVTTQQEVFEVRVIFAPDREILKTVMDVLELALQP